MSLIPKAIELAFAAHEGQLRDEGTPYVQHPLRVWESFKEYRPLGDTPVRHYEELGCVALLHDVLEDCDVSYDQLATEFSPFVAEGVRLLTKFPAAEGVEKAERDAAYFAALQLAHRDVQLIKLLDRLDNLSTLGHSRKPGKLERYIEETERIFVPWAERVSPRVHREMRFLLDDLKGLRSR